ncbi:MAG: hypothetical protein Q9196_005689, partial [Gyalolechia fulgens]
VLYVRPQSHPTASPPSPPGAWAYIGSANCSESAWGKLVMDRKEKKPKLNCRNWECGVVIPLQRTSTTMSGGESNTKTTDMSGLNVFEGSIPIPMQHPGAKYEGKQPWFSSEQYALQLHIALWRKIDIFVTASQIELWCQHEKYTRWNMNSHRPLAGNVHSSCRLQDAATNAPWLLGRFDYRASHATGSKQDTSAEATSKASSSSICSLGLLMNVR